MDKKKILITIGVLLVFLTAATLFFLNEKEIEINVAEISISENTIVKIEGQKGFAKELEIGQKEVEATLSQEEGSEKIIKKTVKDTNSEIPYTNELVGFKIHKIPNGWTHKEISVDPLRGGNIRLSEFRFGNPQYIDNVSSNQDWMLLYVRIRDVEDGFNERAICGLHNNATNREYININSINLFKCFGTITRPVLHVSYVENTHSESYSFEKSGYQVIIRFLVGGPNYEENKKKTNEIINSLVLY